MIYHDLTLEDALAIVEFGVQVHDETRYKKTAYSKEGVLHLLSLIKQHPDKFFIAYTKNNNEEITGLIMGQLSMEYFSGTIIASDLGMFVHPVYRGSSVFYRLLKSFEQWAKDHGASKMLLYHSTGIEPEKTKKLFTKLEYTEFGSIFDKEL